MTTIEMPAAAPEAVRPDSAKAWYLATRADEHARTMRVIRAYPRTQGELQPHPISRSARELVFTFAVDCDLCRSAILNQLELPPQRPSAPAQWADIIAAYEQSYARLVDVVRNMSDDELQETIPFFVGPRTMGQVSRLALLWNMLFTEIHHRGQLSVYLRMSGSKVPSIYGPSYDEPWV